MNKKIIIIITIVLIIVIAVFTKLGIEYISTINRIKESDTYNKNEVLIEYLEKKQDIKIPKGLGDLELEGNVVYSFKSMKSVDELKKEFNELYGEKNVSVKDSKYYYTNTEEGYVVCVQFGGGIFSDVDILNVSPIENFIY